MTTTSPVIRLTRDRPTWLVYLLLAVFATYFYTLNAAVPTIRAELSLTQAQAGLHGTALAVGGILSGITLPYMSRRFGRRAVVWGGTVGICVAMVIIAAGHVLWATLLGYAVASVAGAFALYGSMAVLSDHHGPAGASAITEANAFAVIAGIANTFVFSLASGSVLGWRVTLFVPIVGAAVLALAMGRVWVPPAEPAPEDAAATAAPKVRVPYGWRFHLAGAVLLCCVGLEFCFNLWGAELLHQRTGLSLGDAATGLTAMIIGIAIGRFGGARLVLRYPPGPVLIASLLVTLGGWALFWVTPVTWLAYAGLVLSGLGLSMQFPLALARVLGASGGRADQASGVAAAWASVGAGLAPFALGAFGDAFGTHTAFLLAPGLIVLAACGVLSSRTRS
ncbi:MFS transporter [Streptosporangiaceae bacterium NEAU-GS5]|nr:MFS transporter [Streptosporangiaceae bacterium NEAU-GS5]